MPDLSPQTAAYGASGHATLPLPSWLVTPEIAATLGSATDQATTFGQGDIDTAIATMTTNVDGIMDQVIATTMTPADGKTAIDAEIVTCSAAVAGAVANIGGALKVLYIGASLEPDHT